MTPCPYSGSPDTDPLLSLFVFPMFSPPSRCLPSTSNQEQDFFLSYSRYSPASSGPHPSIFFLSSLFALNQTFFTLFPTSDDSAPSARDPILGMRRPLHSDSLEVLPFPPCTPHSSFTLRKGDSAPTVIFVDYLFTPRFFDDSFSWPPARALFAPLFVGRETQDGSTTSFPIPPFFLALDPV